MSKKTNKKLIMTIIFIILILVIIIVLFNSFRKFSNMRKERQESTVTIVEKEEITKININKADINNLSKLPGIGEIKAKAIFDYRNNIGEFQSLIELTKVKGIGNKTLVKILPYLEMIGDSTEIQAFLSPDSVRITENININNASLLELISLPGIGEKKAQSIIEYREKVGIFKSKEDIKKVKGIGEGIYTKIKDIIEISD